MGCNELAAAAREHHRAASTAEEDAARHRHARDEAIRELRAADPDTWTYAAIADTVGCTRALVRWVLTGDKNRNR